jgi:hypothetical protein
MPHPAPFLYFRYVGLLTCYSKHKIQDKMFPTFPLKPKQV